MTSLASTTVKKIRVEKHSDFGVEIYYVTSASSPFGEAASFLTMKPTANEAKLYISMVYPGVTDIDWVNVEDVFRNEDLSNIGKPHEKGYYWLNGRWVKRRK